MMTNANRDFFIFAGPNGSGKSSIIAKYLQDKPDLNYYCADQTAKEPAFQAIKDEDQRNFQAMKETEARVYAAMEEGYSVAYETVLSSDYKWPIFDRAAALGYCITAVFISTKDPQINVARVRKREEAGGHSVPKKKILARYEKSMNRLGKLLTYTEDAVAYDNSIEDVDATLVLMKHDTDILIRGACKWVVRLMAAWRKEQPTESGAYQFRIL